VGVAEHQVEEERARLVEEGCGGSMPGHPAAAHSHSRGASAWLHLGSLNSAWRQAERAGGCLGTLLAGNLGQCKLATHAPFQASHPCCAGQPAIQC
jgi:hypothetical protein